LHTEASKLGYWQLLHSIQNSDN